jgi:hypothetical protein
MMRDFKAGAIASRRGNSVRQRRDRDNFNKDVGLRKRCNPDHFRGWRVVVAAVLRAMLGKELVQHVQAKIGRAQNAAIGKWPFDEEGQPDEMIERTAEFPPDPI